MLDSRRGPCTGRLPAAMSGTILIVVASGAVNPAIAAESAWNLQVGLARGSLHASTLTSEDEVTFLETAGETGLALQLAHTRTLQPGLDASFTLAVWSRRGEDAPSRAGIDLAVLSLGLRWRPAGGVWFLEGGVGGGRLRAAVLDRGVPAHRGLYGFAFTGGTGVELALGGPHLLITQLGFLFAGAKEFGAWASVASWTIGYGRCF